MLFQGLHDIMVNIRVRVAVAVAVAIAVAAVGLAKVAPLMKDLGILNQVTKPEHAQSVPLEYKPCLKNCSCYRNDSISAVHVQCGDKNLTSVPQITEDYLPVLVLNLSHNNFQNLQKLEFARNLAGYKSVKDLYLQYCELTIIDEKVFYGFKNLTVVNLSNNRLLSIPPNLFNDSNLLQNLYLQNNDLRYTDPNTPFLAGPPSLIFLNLQACHLSNLSSATFSLLPNLTILDISRNKLESLKSESLYFLSKLEDMNVESNRLKCGPEFEDLMCWMNRKLFASHNRNLECWHDNGTLETWTSEKRSSLCCIFTTPSLTQAQTPDVSATTSVSQGTPYSEHAYIIDTNAIVTLSVAAGIGAFIGACIGDCGYIRVKHKLSLGGNGEGGEEAGEAQTESLLQVD
jgi:hypothetical protein